MGKSQDHHFRVKSLNKSSLRDLDFSVTSIISRSPRLCRTRFTIHACKACYTLNSTMGAFPNRAAVPQSMPTTHPAGEVGDRRGEVGAGERGGTEIGRVFCSHARLHQQPRTEIASNTLKQTSVMLKVFVNFGALRVGNIHKGVVALDFGSYPELSFGEVCWCRYADAIRTAATLTCTHTHTLLQ
jgi:hypothetical protein